MSGFNGYLRRNRYGIYSYRRVLPELARASFGGRSEFIRSLATRNRRDAILLAQQLNLQVEESIRTALDQTMPKHRIDYTHIVKFEPDGTRTHTLDVTPEDIKAWQAAGLTPEQIATLLAPQSSGQHTPKGATKNPAIPLSALFQRFTADLVGSKKPGWLPPKNYETYQRRLIEILGDRPIDEVRREDARKVRESLQSLPANTARHKGKTIPEILTIAVDGPKFAERNINNHLEYYGRVFGWAMSEALLPVQNPFTGIRVEASKGDGMSRDLFTLLELNKIFGTDLYTNYGADPTHKPYRFWLPLLLLTSGARRAEIAGLYLEDIRKEGRTWIIDINCKQPDKRLKTANAARVTPIHPEILKRTRSHPRLRQRRQG